MRDQWLRLGLLPFHHFYWKCSHFISVLHHWNALTITSSLLDCHICCGPGGVRELLYLEPHVITLTITLLYITFMYIRCNVEISCCVVCFHKLDNKLLYVLYTRAYSAMPTRSLGFPFLTVFAVSLLRTWHPGKAGDRGGGGGSSPLLPRWPRGYVVLSRGLQTVPWQQQGEWMLHAHWLAVSRRCAVIGCRLTL